MSDFGKEGIQYIAKRKMYHAHYLKNILVEQYGRNVLYSDRFYNEIVVDIKQPIEEINTKRLDAGNIGGYDLEKVLRDLNRLVLSRDTNTRTKSEIDKLAKELRDHYAN